MLRFWHNPRCSKSREAAARRAARGVEADVVDNLAQPPTAAEVATLLRRLGGDPRALVRFKEDEARALGVSPADERTTAEWAALLAAHPRLIERPVLEAEDRAVIGRPVEVLDALIRSSVEPGARRPNP